MTHYSFEHIRRKEDSRLQARSLAVPDVTTFATSSAPELLLPPPPRCLQESTLKYSTNSALAMDAPMHRSLRQHGVAGPWSTITEARSQRCPGARCRGGKCNRMRGQDRTAEGTKALHSCDPGTLIVDHGRTALVHAPRRACYYRVGFFSGAAARSWPVYGPGRCYPKV